MSEALIKVKNLDVRYNTRVGSVRAVENITLDILRGETLGLVGESGCGKSTLGFALMRLIPSPGRISGGEIRLDGQDILKLSQRQMQDIRGRRIAMIFQDPMTSLDPLQTIGDHIVETIRSHEGQTSRQEAWDRAERLVDRLGIGSDRLRDYPHQFSGGMRQRIAIALALALRPELVIADEPTTSLDVIVEAQILDLLNELKDDYNLTLILITHNMGIVAEMADRIAVMYAGQIAELSPAERLFDDPLHPYTEGLLRSVPTISLDTSELKTMPGAPPDLIYPPSGCRFHPRCPYAWDRCVDEVPPSYRVAGRRYARCFLFEQGRPAVRSPQGPREHIEKIQAESVVVG